MTAFVPYRMALSQDPVMCSNINVNTDISSCSLSFLENEVSQVKLAIDGILMAFHLMQPFPFAATLPESRLQIRDKSEIGQMTESDLLQELSNVKAAILHIQQQLGGADEGSLQAEISAVAHELARISARDVPEEEDQDTLYCICRLPYNGARMMMQCDTCQDWFHITCVGILYSDVANTDTYACPNCERSNEVEGGVQAWDYGHDLLSVDPVLCRKGVTWLEGECETVQNDINDVDLELKKIDSSLKRSKIRHLTKLKEENLKVARPALEVGQEIQSMSGVELCKEVQRLMHEYSITQAQLAAESHMPGGPSALSPLLRGQHVSKREEKEDVLRLWLAQTKSRILSGDLIIRPKKPLPSPHPPRASLAPKSRVRFTAGSKCDARSCSGDWHLVDVLSVSKSRVKVHWPSSMLKDSWLTMKGGRLAQANTRSGTKQTSDDGRKRAPGHELDVPDAKRVKVESVTAPMDSKLIVLEEDDDDDDGAASVLSHRRRNSRRTSRA